MIHTSPVQDMYVDAESRVICLHKPVSREFKRLRVIVGGLHNQYYADLVDMQKLKEKNDGVRFLLIVINMFS